MKISIYDRYQALQNSDRYRKDYEEYVQQRGNQNDWAVGDHIDDFHPKLSDPAKTLCSKWRLRYPIDPDIEYHEEYIYSVVDPPIKYLDPPEKWEGEIAAIGWRNNEKETVFTHVNGKLVLMIDTSRSFSDLKKAFQLFLKRWVKPPPERVGKTSVDPWDVYDKHEIQGKSLLQITRDMFGTDINPNYDEAVDASYHRVKRSYSKACDIIKFVEDQAKPPTQK